jgi:hypothetical protein
MRELFLMESFPKGCTPHARRICHHQISFPWGYIKDIASRSNPRNLDELKTSISNIIVDISLMTLQAVSTNMLL